MYKSGIVLVIALLAIAGTSTPAEAYRYPQTRHSYVYYGHDGYYNSYRRGARNYYYHNSYSSPGRSHTLHRHSLHPHSYHNYNYGSGFGFGFYVGRPGWWSTTYYSPYRSHYYKSYYGHGGRDVYKHHHKKHYGKRKYWGSRGGRHGKKHIKSAHIRRGGGRR